MLSLLELAGYIKFTDEEETVSRLYITATRSQLYSAIYGETEILFNQLLRQYTGIFQEFVYIDEEDIALRIGFPVKKIYETLIALNQRHVIKYIPRKRIPYITLTRPRVEGKNVIIPAHAYEERYTRQKRRTDCVIQYINNSTDCRTAQLLKYFGEKFDQKCMNCDNCDSLSGADTPSSVIDSIYHDICSQLSNGPKYGYELNLAIYNPEDIEYVIRTMTENGELIQCGLQIKLNK